MELPNTLYDQIEKLSKQGNKAMDDKDYQNAMVLFQKAEELLPLPKEKWDAYIWLSASVGDAYFMMQDYGTSLNYFCRCYKLGEIDNPFILLRIGENYFELQDYNNAKEFLLRTYMIEGKKIFKNGKKYLQWLSENVDLKQKKSSSKTITAKTKVFPAFDEDGDLFNQYIDETALCESHEYEKMIELIKRYWDMLPEPKTAQSLGYHLLCDMVITYLRMQEYTMALHWARVFDTFDFVSDGRIDSGEKDYYVAICYYKNEDINKAKEYFTAAKVKSKGRCFANLWGDEYKKICKELNI